MGPMPAKSTTPSNDERVCQRTMISSMRMFRGTSELAKERLGQRVVECPACRLIHHPIFTGFCPALFSRHTAWSKMDAQKCSLRKVCNANSEPSEIH